jgi:hypothetical protein
MNVDTVNGRLGQGFVDFPAQGEDIDQCREENESERGLKRGKIDEKQTLFIAFPVVPLFRT